MSDLQQNMRLMQIAQQKKQMAEPIIAARMREELFPEKEIPEGWREKILLAIRNTCPISQRVELKIFAETVALLSTGNQAISMAHFQVMANSLDAVAPAQLGISDDQYLQLVDQTIKMVELWGKAIARINTEAQLQVERDYKMREAAENGKQKDIMKPVIGEA